MQFAQEVSLLMAISAGLLSFISPCVLPLLPVYISYITGLSIEDLTAKERTSALSRKIFLSAVMFVLGFTLIFTLMGATASLIGQFLIKYRDAIRIIAGIVIILFGLHLAGIFKIGFLYREKRADFAKFRSLGYLSPLFMGMAFTAGWTPCIGPILSSILIYASTTKTVWQGMGLLAAYSLGLGLPLLLTALAVSVVLSYLAKLKRYMGIISKVSGAILIIVGILIIFNFFQRFAGYLTG